MKTQKIYCIACRRMVDAEQRTGADIYPTRADLAASRFYRCQTCGNYVGTHRDGRPLGTIPPPELRNYRRQVHAVIDTYWLPTKDTNKRKELYADLSRLLGRKYHTGTLGTVEECQQVIKYYVDNYRDRI